eukprot:NODE_2224_length_604_cov_155.971171_g1757_i0.p1 GENE.NODE_2224_length_604_cov_155.971171_g1757_i0~~NODE_2224_length_604_cov_155.971171_g1757_i0.p1  ORF type:complete len:135 (-),score=22.66 NODE_2224_length_604_cov_155.971171_g1757_i0:119-523(-)
MKPEEAVEFLKSSEDVVALSYNHLGVAGISAIAAELPNLKCKDIYLTCNQMGSEGAIILAKAIVQSKSLTSLFVYQNQIKNDGALALLEAIQQNTNIVRMGLNFNDFDEELFNKLQAQLDSNAKLQADRKDYVR